jgi:hypothetical protein
VGAQGEPRAFARGALAPQAGAAWAAVCAQPQAAVAPRLN